MAEQDIGRYLMQWYHWTRPHQYNRFMPPAVAEEKPNPVSGNVTTTVIWQVAARRSTYKKFNKRSALYKAKRKIEKAKVQVRVKVEHPFRVIKRQFGYTKVRFRRLVKNTAQLVTLFALSNHWMARRHLLTNAGEVRL